VFNKIFVLRERQQFPIVITEAWSFFVKPKNLAQITPPSLNLIVTNDMPDEMHEGMIIAYAITSVLMIKLNWVTEITSMNPPPTS
jgi:ligand-binding SRPBCC domain-containing protein